MAIDNNALLQALFEWVHVDNDLCVAATLTFRPRLNGMFLTQEHAQGAIRHYRKRLATAAYGRGGVRRKKQVKVIAAREGSVRNGDKHLHYHLKVGLPEGFVLDDWKAICIAEWQKVDWASPRYNAFSWVWSDGWLRYILKRKDKPDYMLAMDFENWQIK